MITGKIFEFCPEMKNDMVMNKVAIFKVSGTEFVKNKFYVFWYMIYTLPMTIFTGTH